MPSLSEKREQSKGESPIDRVRSCRVTMKTTNCTIATTIESKDAARALWKKFAASVSPDRPAGSSSAWEAAQASGWTPWEDGRMVPHDPGLWGIDEAAFDLAMTAYRAADAAAYALDNQAAYLARRDALNALYEVIG